MKKYLTSAGIVVLAAIAPLKASASTFSQLYVFGDSLSDPGNLYQATLQIIPQTPPYSGKFSNDRVWVEYLAESLGTLEPALLSDVVTGDPETRSDGIYFAFGGAGTGVENILAPMDLLNTGALAQVSAFAGSGITPAEDALFIYLAGANDLAGSQATPPQTDISVPLDNTLLALNLLVGTGAKNILVSNLPDISTSPRFSILPEDQQAFFSNLVTTYNAELSAIVNNLSVAIPDITFFEFDYNGLLSEAIADPGKFGFTNVTSPCLTDYTFPIDTDGFSVCENPDSYLFWDDFHPTSKANEFVAQAAFAQVQGDGPESVPESGMGWGLLAFGGATAGMMYRRRQFV